MTAVSFSVQRGIGLGGLINRVTKISFIALGKEFSGDELVVAEGRIGEGARGAEGGGRRREGGIGVKRGGERGDAGVEDGDDDRRCEGGEGPDAGGGGEVEERWGVRGVEGEGTVREDGEDVGEAAESGGLGGGEESGEAGGDAVVGVEDFGGRVVAGKGIESGRVPVDGGGEGGWAEGW